MCTLIVAWQVFEDAPVCVAANRDEQFGRPASPPMRWDTDPVVVAPRDEEAGGTWIGYNESGLLVAVTNRWQRGDSGRSRGRLVTDALSKRSVDAALECVESTLETETYAPFHLLLVDETRCVVVVHDGETTEIRRLAPGVHTVVNVGIDGDVFVPPTRPEAGRTQAKNARTIRRRLQPTAAESASAWLNRAASALGDHDIGLCVHGDSFGTRSSSLLCLPRSGPPVYDYADGPPCTTPYERVEARD
ncbi:MAG: NRDE family protein [Natronomonas sp.]